VRETPWFLDESCLVTTSSRRERDPNRADPITVAATVDTIPGSEDGSMRQADVVICGAGIAGIAAAYELAVVRRAGRVLIVDPEPPLSVTSDKSTECYRNFWPAPELVGFMNRSIDRLDAWHHESGGRFSLSRNGYAYFTASASKERTAPSEDTRSGPTRIEASEAYLPAAL
jgi:glycine/D-amino acid oxidase-like deaminating enzyme